MLFRWHGSCKLSDVDISNRTELQERIEEKKNRMQAELEKLKADTRSETREREQQLEQRLDELKDHLQSGWDNVSEQVSGKLNDWLKRTN